MKVENLDIPDNYKKDFIDSGITELNPPQQQAVDKGLLDGDDMIIASPTASGKTFIAELGILKQVVEGKDGTAIYIVPLKALASEKYSDFTERYNELDVRISVGDMDDDGENLQTADIIIATSEKLDSLLRHNPSWIHKINLVVVDEIHLLTSENRGPTLEVTITRLRELLDFQMLGLSATISNSNQLSEWLNAKHVESSYRPVELQHGIQFQNNIEFIPENKAKEIKPEKEKDNSTGFKTGKDILSEGQTSEEGKKTSWDDVKTTYNLPNDYDSPVQNTIEDTLNKDKQCLVFCNSRKGAEKESDRSAKTVKQELTRKEKQKLEETSQEVLNALGNPTSQCKRLAENIKKGAAFHHAGLISQQRKAVEKAFKQGHIKTISATPTLAAGVNLPAYRVIIRDLKRYTGQGMDYIPVLEYEQMTGRAGRPKYDDKGEAISLAKNKGMKSEIKDRYILGDPENIQSKLAVEPVLRMHVLALIASKFCTNEEELFRFFDKTFYSHQYEGAESVQDKIKKVLKQLEDYGFLKENTFGATKTGERVSELYIDPDSAHLILNSLERAEKQEKTKAISYLFMLSRTSELQPRLNVKDQEWSDIEQGLFDAEDYLLEEIPAEWNVEYDVFIESMKTAMMMQSWIDETDEQKIMDEYGIAPGGIRAKTKNADWLLYASKELARMKSIEVENELEKTRIRLKHGIREELLKLVKYDQIGRVRARKLHDFGIETQQDIRDTSFEKLKKLIGEKTARKLKKQVGQENIFDRENIMDYFD